MTISKPALLAALFAALLAFYASRCHARPADDGIWRWDSAGAHVEIQDVIRDARTGKRLSDFETQRALAADLTGSPYVAPGIRYVPMSAAGACVRSLRVSFPGAPARVSERVTMTCGKGLVAGVAVLPRSRPLVEASTVAVELQGLGVVTLKRKGTK